MFWPVMTLFGVCAFLLFVVIYLMIDSNRLWKCIKGIDKWQDNLLADLEKKNGESAIGFYEREK